MHIYDDIKLDFCDVLLRPQTSSLTSRADVTLEREFKFRHSGRTWKGIPIIASNMDTIGTFDMALALSKYKMLTALHKFYTVNEIKEFFDENSPNGELADYVLYSTGIRDSDILKLQEAKSIGLSKQFNNILIDVPNGYIRIFAEKVKEIRKMFPRHTIFAGNVVTGDIAEHLIQNCGVDVVKIGIGPGAACTTRKLTGVGYPQLSAVIESANSAHGVKGWICSDGGCRSPGDVATAICGGADFVMLGFMLAGHDQCGEELVTEIDPYKKVPTKMKFYGMSSKEAMIKYYGEVAPHRAPEGQTLEVEYRGDVEETVLEILGGVRSCATYIGAEKLKEMHKRATFVRVNGNQK